METNNSNRSNNRSSGAPCRITGKRKHFINRNRARAKESEDVPQPSEDGPEEAGLWEFQPLSVDDYQTLLQILNINLPEGALNPEVSHRSTHPEVIKNSKDIVEKLRSSQLTIIKKPRLSCVKVKHAFVLRDREKITDFLQMLFFKKRTKASERTLKELWETSVPASGCRFRMRDSFKKTPVFTPQKSARAPRAQRAWFGNPADNKMSEMDCFRFILQQKGLQQEEATYKREYTVESGFISGRLDFLLELKHSAESSAACQSEKIIIECKFTRGDMVGDVFTLCDGEHQAEFNKHHEYYRQTQAYLYMLKKEVSPVPVRAVMVVKVTAEETKFYSTEVEDDMENMEELNTFCQEEALPHFLAVLNLIFQKVTEREEEEETEDVKRWKESAAADQFEN